MVFPELSLTGYEVERAPALGFTVDDPRLEPIAGTDLGDLPRTLEFPAR